ncbi:futalosine hydrolase [Streptomyces rapamycinicus]|uniref:Futalosine hydrolase n=2 Tax=Streptomyces rapamycinicus TaxID=1226757 RepID=A0A0A0NC76_STRRN|nr:futalosine hydrolase [Streptomyces rapamycinicus]AGP57062.1 futalosine nucleosidase [Streptomyces rapamycinicus NRRL 5491]MBB4784696.1 futalosine hydrolase [Streptomyces rapamycinicus]RLV79825.1 futalosine nucleosidase [Streptomyces rapamycinicus NRRL 5491]UTO64967.1 futalosine hydrolase [Streptomyces rapamycinicus]UTP32923.1 futalosine hydrolase [Streptomyces rapamycinicus NRRL 5491]
MRVLIVTAVPAERDAVVRGVGATAPELAELPVPGGVLHRLSPAPPSGPPLTVDVLAAGVGPAAAAAGTAAALTAAAVARTPYDLAVSAGIGGGFTTARPVATLPATTATARPATTATERPAAAHLGSVVVADAIVAADLGAETPDGFAAVTDLGFGTVEHLPPAPLVAAVAEATDAVRGTVLTVSTVTGSAERAAELLRRHPRAVAEAMEGFGVAEAAAAQSVPALEVRTVSNAVGPRDRAAWRIGEALEALTGAFASVAPLLGTWTFDPEGTRQ